MAEKLDKHMFVIDAPAGSGKTTDIIKRVSEVALNNKYKQILCITFTNRAAEELSANMASNVIVSTIHSFIYKFFNIYFTDKKVIELYIDQYNDQIDYKLSKENAKDIERYEEIFGVSPSKETIICNIHRLKYTETQFANPWYGELSHDSLLQFSKEIIDKFPKLRRRLTDKFSHVFIDEYQDTDSDVLFLFYCAIKGSNTRLYLYGDKMQQIYDAYDGSFEPILEQFDSSTRLRNNYRSSHAIVHTLNSIYNHVDYAQCSRTDVKGDKPEFIVADHMEKYQLNDALSLKISNQKRFSDWGCGNIFHAYQNIPKYKHGQKHSAADVLSRAKENDNPDDLLKLLSFVDDVCAYISDRRHSDVIRLLKSSDYISDASCKFDNKNSIEDAMNEVRLICKEYNDLEYVKDLSSKIQNNEMFSEKAKNILTRPEYEHVTEIKMDEVLSLMKNISNPQSSTQHGVKGEGHNLVTFFCEDSKPLNVRMYDFLELLSKKTFNLNFQDLQNFYYSIKRKFYKIFSELDVTSFSKINSTAHVKCKPKIQEFLQDLSKDVSVEYYKEFLEDPVQKYSSNETLKNLKEIKLRRIEGVLNAYKLFYVGCSRAKFELKVIVDKSKINHFQADLITKMKRMGFDVPNC